MEVVVMSNKKITIIVHCLLQFIYSLNYVIGIIIRAVLPFLKWPANWKCLGIIDGRSRSEKYVLNESESQ